MSSSSDEAVSYPPPPPAAVAKARASSPDLSDDELAAVKPWLDKVLEAFINIPAEDAEKGISMNKVRRYFREKHRATKAIMQKDVNPALRIALARKFIIKTTALNNVGIGSARLNPAYAISRLRHSEESASAATEDEKGGRKRKASANEDGTKSVKRRFPFGKAH